MSKSFRLQKPASPPNYVHPSALVDPSVEMGTGNYIGPNCLIAAGVKIGNNNRFEAFCSIGTAPEHTQYWKGEYKSVEIGNDCTIREFVTVNAGTINDTRISSNVALLRGSYVGHDSVLENDVTVSCNAMIGGHCYIFRGANLGLSVAIHQFSVIGHYAMLGMSTVVTKRSQIEPGKTFIGIPARHLKKNEVGLIRNHVDDILLVQLNLEYQQMRQKMKTLKEQIQLRIK